MRMRAAILAKPGVVQLSNFEVPHPSHGEMLIKVKLALTCGTDLKAFLQGHSLIPMPGRFGHEFSGIVAEIGKGVRQFSEGDEIMAVHSAPCLECRWCGKKLYNLCENIMQTKILGAFADYILLPSHIVKQNVFHKPGNISFEEAALLEPVSCVVHGIHSLHLKTGEHALVIGAGPIGLIHLLLLKAKGLQVTVMDKNDGRLSIAKKLGADWVMTSEENEPPTNFIGFDYVFECTGSREIWEKSVNSVRRGGVVILFGGCKPRTKVCYDAGRLHYDEITLKGVFHYTPADVRKAYGLICKKTINFSRLISGKIPLNRTQKAFEKLSKGKGIKYAIIP